MSRFCLVLAAALLAAALPARAEGEAPAATTAAVEARPAKLKLAVMDLTASGVSGDLAATVTGLVAAEIERQEVFNVVSKAEIRAMLNFEAQKQALGCDAGASCMSDLGGALGVRYLVSGSLGLIGDTYALNLALTDAQASRVENRISENAKEQSKLLEVAARASRLLVSKILSDRQATLLVTCGEVGANVKIDGQIVGVTPLPRRKITWGPHLLEVEKKGFVTGIEDFTVLTNGFVERQVTLIPSPDFLADYEGGASKMRWGAWLSTGAAVAAFGVAGYFQVDHLRLASVYDEALRTYSDPAKPQTMEAWRDLESKQKTALSSIFDARVSAGVGAAAAIAAAYFWIAGDDPERYARYREVASSDDAPRGPAIALELFGPAGLVGASVALP